MQHPPSPPSYVASSDGDGRINRDSSSSSSSRVIHDLNFTDTVALLLACPPYFFACITALLLAWSSGRYHERTWHITIGFAVAIVGFVIAASTTNTAGRYVACFVFAAGAFAVNSVITGWIATTLSQSQEKKAVCSFTLFYYYFRAYLHTYICTLLCFSSALVSSDHC